MRDLRGRYIRKERPTTRASTFDEIALNCSGVGHQVLGFRLVTLTAAASSEATTEDPTPVLNIKLILRSIFDSKLVTKVTPLPPIGTA